MRMRFVVIALLLAGCATGGEADSRSARPVQDAGVASAEDRDAQPLVRVPPEGFGRCVAGATRPVEVVHLTFDVTADGRPTNVRVIDTTNSCYDSASIEAVRKWRYDPKVIDGRPVTRRGVEVTMRYQTN